jgi:hypothetical protein
MSYTRQTFRYNNTELVFTHSIYVSPTGNDSTGNGTKNKPYKTIQFATNKVVNDTTAIILLPGTYNENPYVNTSATDGTAYYYNGNVRRYAKVSMNKGLFMSTTYKTNFLGYPNQTFVNVVFNQPNCSVVMAGRTKPVYMYGITVNVNCSQATAVDSNCFIGALPDSQGAYMYNCIFKYVQTFANKRGIMHSVYNASAYYAYNCIFDMGDITNAYSGNRHTTMYESDIASDYYHSWWGNWYVMSDAADPSENSQLNAYNSIFLNIQNWLAEYSGTNGAVIACTNCIIPNTANYYNVTLTNCIKDDAKLDDNFHQIQSTIWKNSGVSTIMNADNTVSNIGVYGGIYQWNELLSEQATIMMDNFQAVVNKGSSINYGFTISPPTTRSVEKYDDIFSGNFIDSNNLKYSYLLDKRAWSKLNRVEFL